MREAQILARMAVPTPTTRGSAMEIALSDDQEFFRDTTRKFLGQRVPDPEGARAALEPGRLRARLLAPGRRAGLDVAAGARGARRRQRQRERAGRPRPRGRRVRRATSRRGHCSRATSWPPRSARSGQRPSSRPRSCPRSSPATSSPRGPSPRRRRTTGSVTSPSGPRPTAATSCSPA